MVYDVRLSFHTALPFKFIEPLTDTTVVIGDTASLSCKVSKTGARIQWFKDGKLLEQSKGVDIINEGLVQILRLHNVNKPVDVATYCCKLKKGDRVDETSCALAIEGRHVYRLHLSCRSSTTIIMNVVYLFNMYSRNVVCIHVSNSYRCSQSHGTISLNRDRRINAIVVLVFDVPTIRIQYH